MAIESDAAFYEVYIEIVKEDAISRLLERGVWGEEGSPRLTEEDLPEITDLYETMKMAMGKRDIIKIITSKSGDIEGAYQRFLAAIQ